MNQRTLKNSYSFEGKGLHTGKYSRMTICPAAEDTGIRFIRTDISDDAFIDALATNVSNTARSTTISQNGISVVTIEHIMSALTGLGVDNAIIKIDNEEVPILDGSASYYIKAICADGLVEQNSERKYLEIKEFREIINEKSGSYIRIFPADRFSIDLTLDFESKVLGIQKVHWDEDTDYAAEIGICRTFVFFHEIEFLASQGLVKGGDVDNAIVIVEHPVSDEQLENICRIFNKDKVAITDEGYLNNLELHFSDECGRHKLLDMLGDLRLAGGFPKVRIEAFKSGHTINTNAAKAIFESKK
ncbi:MAG: UDP-3-O-acyl-N-acetylglucosamine deacetylase [Bacteroidales bacterium]|nr:UDP-3-O-acyl-N-acetylglucosamine deacetylase [Bacteroidales bacterium]